MPSLFPVFYLFYFFQLLIITVYLSTINVDCIYTVTLPYKWGTAVCGLKFMYEKYLFISMVPLPPSPSYIKVLVYFTVFLT